MPSHIQVETASSSPVESVVVGLDTIEKSRGNHAAVKQTNIEVCARVRPLMVASSSGNKFFEKRSHVASSSRRQPPLSPSGTRPSRPSLIPGGSRIPSPRKPPIPERQSNSDGDRRNTPASPNNSCGDATISAWDVIGDATVAQSAATKPVPGRTTSYCLDRVYGPHSTTASLYDQSVRNLVVSAMEGYHASVFAYGQTSTGKTFTMTGTKESPGIAPLAVRDCFRYVANLNSPREYLLRMSYMEIYNEQIVDLLVPTAERKTMHHAAIRIFESKQEGVIVRGLREEIVSSPEEVFNLISVGEARRQVGSTNMNTHSSRSHCIFRLIIESRTPKFRNPSSSSGASISSSSTATESVVGGGPVRVSSLNLVDLAGSESAKLTGSSGDRRKEGQYINKSLSTLGRVIFQLSEWSSRNRNTPNGTSTPRHIPYRDSKLTRLLQPSLSGNAQIVIICNISPQPTHIEESHNTLKFAMRAKRIQQTVSVTEVVDDKTLLQTYRDEIEDLKQQLKAAQEAQKVLQEQQKASASTDETRELVEAIQKMEKLILKANSDAQKKNNTDIDDDFLLSSNLDGLLIGDDDVSGEITMGDSAEEAKGNVDGDVQLVGELHRIQGLLGNMLKRKGASNASTPTKQPVSDLEHSTPERDVEVEQLRAQLHEKEVTTSLRKADSNFLQSQLVEKDNLLREVSKILDALEKRQIELETENAKLKDKIALLESEELLI